MKKTFLNLTVLVLTAPILFSNCATIFGKSSYPFSVNTNPTGANVSITDRKGKEIFKGQSPAIAKLKSGAGYFSKAEYQIKLSAPGYSEQTIPVTFKLNGWYFGNLVIGGLIGILIVDPISGAMWKLRTPPIDVALNKSTAVLTEPTLKIIDIKDAPQSMRETLVRLK